MISNVDIYDSYADVNEVLELTGEEALSNDKNTEDPALIVGVRKWSWEHMDEKGPCNGLFGISLSEHVKIYDKYDIFIYER